jgi:hypothetical protein
MPTTSTPSVVDVLTGWQSIETAPLAEMVLLWNPVWRHPFPGRRNGDFGQCFVDTCEPLAAGWQTNATHWMPLPAPPALASAEGQS